MIGAPLLVTGIGVVSPIGIGYESFARAVLESTCGIRPVARFDVGKYRARVAGAVDEAWIREHAPYDGALDPCGAMAIAAAREALASADCAEVPRERIGIVLGSSAGGFVSRTRFEMETLDEEARWRALSQSGFHCQTEAVADALGLRGPRVTVSTACTSSAQAMASAALLLDGGDADVVVAGGVDVLIEAVYAGFFAMGAMSAVPCAPFSTPEGMTVGEGAGFFVLERRRRAGTRVRAAITGFASTCDAHHATAPESTGKQLARAMTLAIADASIAPGDIGWVSAHGTGTESNDPAEHNAIRSVLGRGAVVTASKSAFGHALGAASVLELAAAIVGFENGVVPATNHHVGSRFQSEIDVVTAPRPSAARHVLKSAAAFGGFNAAMVIARDAEARPAARGEDVVVVGVSHERFDEADRRASEAAAIADVRAFDCLGRHLLVLAHRALPIPIRGKDRERAGIIVGAPAMAWDTLDELWGAIKERGYERSSAPAFARTVVNAPAGAVARALGLKGPCSTIASRAVSGALAIVEATRTLARPSVHADLLVAASAYEMDATLRWHHALRYRDQRRTPCDGGAAIVLARRSFAEARGLTVLGRVASTAVAGPSMIRDAIDRAGAFDQAIVACADDDDARAAVFDALGDARVVDASSHFGDPESLDALAATLALEQRGRTLVLAYDQAVGAVAVVFDTRDPKKST